MYFDVDYWWRVVRHTWGLKAWPGRPRMLLRLLLLQPLLYLLHASCFLLDYLFFPSLWRAQVKQPVFIIGHARSGTTLMHRLMSADADRFSYFLYWETFFPSLLQKKTVRLLGYLDGKVFGGFLQQKVRAWDDKTFGPYRHMHDMSLFNAEEDCFAMQAAFVSQQWSLEIPMMEVVDFFHLDAMPKKRRRWMHHYRELVKRQLLHNGGNKIHLSKNPVMSGWVESLIAAFPDARFVVMMRDPVACIPSCLKLVEASWKHKGWRREDCEASLARLTEISFEHFTHPREVLARYPATPQVVVDYRQLTTSPRETVIEVYGALGMSLAQSHDDWLRARAEQERAHHSKFEYSLGEFHLSAAQIEQRLESFYQQYQWQESS